MSAFQVVPRSGDVADEGPAPRSASASTSLSSAATKLAALKQRPLVKGALEVARVFSEAHVLQLAAAIAFFVLLSLGPVVLVLLSVAGFVFGEDAVQGRVFGSLQGVVGEDSALFVQELVERSAGEGQGAAAVIGLLLFLWTASGVFAQVSDALVIVRRVATGKEAKLQQKEPPSSKWHRLARGGWALVRSRVFSALAIVLTATLLLLTMVASSVISAVTARFEHLIDLSGTITWINGLVSLALFTAFTTVLYRLLTTPRLPLPSAVVGGGLAAVLFLVARSFVGNLVARLASESTFGTAASVIAVLVWAWVSATILLIGGAAASVHDDQRQLRLTGEHVAC